MNIDHQIQQFRTSLLQNQQTLIEILQPYKKIKKNNTVVTLQIDDFVQVFSRIKLQQVKLKELFCLFEEYKGAPQFGKYDKLIQSQLQTIKKLPKKLDNQLVGVKDQLLENLAQLNQMPKTTLEMDIMQDLYNFGKMLQTAHFVEDLQTQPTDLSGLCNEAYKGLCEKNDQPFQDEHLSPINKHTRNLIPHPTPASASASMDFSKLTVPQQEASYVMRPHDGEWDSKLESKIDTSLDRSHLEFDKIKKAIQVLEQANVLDPENLQMLVRCSEVRDNQVDRQMFLDFFLQVVRLKRQKDEVPNKNDQTQQSLRKQFLQVPFCQEFSFESPLPSLRNQLPQQPAQQLKHVQLEDLLQVQSVVEKDLEQEDVSQRQYEQSPKQHFSKKSKPKQQLQPARVFEKVNQKYVSKSTHVTHANSINTSQEGSFYSQKNIKTFLTKAKPRKSSQQSQQSLLEQPLIILKKKPLKRSHSQPSVNQFQDMVQKIVGKAGQNCLKVMYKQQTDRMQRPLKKLLPKRCVTERSRSQNQ